MPHTVHHLPFTAVTSGPEQYWFGYYDKFPWDATGRYLLTATPTGPTAPLTGGETLRIGLIDLHDGNRLREFDTTAAWCWQQGTMLQWLPHAADRLVIYNRLDDGRFVSVIRDVHTGETRILPRPIYCVSPDGSQALSLNFARLGHTRPGYGYVTLPDPWRNVPTPEDDGIYHLDLRTGESRMLFSIADVARLDHAARPLPGCAVWFNHLLFNTDGSRFIFLLRWMNPQNRRITCALTAASDGSDLRVLNDHTMTSHFDWRDRDTLLAWARREDRGQHYYLFNDRTGTVDIMGEELFTTDGHCSYSPDRRWVLTDTYPDAESYRTLILYDIAGNHRIDIGRFYSQPDMKVEVRCDLHPRWSRDGRQVCFDSAHTGERQMYVMDVSGIVGG